MMYYAAFDTLNLGALGKLTLTRATFSDIEINFSNITDTSVAASSGATIFFHAVYAALDPYQRVTGQDEAATVKLTHYARRPFSFPLMVALQDAATAASWTTPSGLAVSHSYSTGIYTLSAPYAFGYSFSTAAGAELLGFSSLSGAAATSHVGTVVPTYTISPTLQFASGDTPNFEPDGIANHCETDNGSGGGMSRTVAPQYRSFRQEYETKAKTIRAAASASHPWTFQDLIEHCRGTYSFMIVDGFGAGTNEVFSLRSKSTSWNPRRASEGNDSQFHIDFDAVVEGTMASYTP